MALSSVLFRLTMIERWKPISPQRSRYACDLSFCLIFSSREVQEDWQEESEKKREREIERAIG